MTFTGSRFSEIPADAGISEAQVYAAIENVLDPELDEPLVTLGFIDQVSVTGSDVTIVFKLPTYWCAPNFAYLMASDLRAHVRALPGIGSIKIMLSGNFAEDEINAGINQGKCFAEAFADDADDDQDLEDLRLIFLRKGFLKRQDTLIRQLLKAGLDEHTLLQLCLTDITIDKEHDRVIVANDRRQWILENAAKNTWLYMLRRREIGVSQECEARLVTDEAGQPVPVGGLQNFLRHSRAVRLSIMFNTSMCKGLFRTRYENAGAIEAHRE
jgi:metal-sulfur cluster biosynthetic enzyme